MHNYNTESGNIRALCAGVVYSVLASLHASDLPIYLYQLKPEDLTEVPHKAVFDLAQRNTTADLAF